MLGIEHGHSHMLRRYSVTALHFPSCPKLLLCLSITCLGGQGSRNGAQGLARASNPSIAEPPSTSRFQLYEIIYFV